MKEDSFLYTIDEVADYLRVSTMTLKRAERRGQLKPIRIHSRGDRRYTKEMVDNYLKKWN